MQHGVGGIIAEGDVLEQDSRPDGRSGNLSGLGGFAIPTGPGVFRGFHGQYRLGVLAGFYWFIQKLKDALRTREGALQAVELAGDLIDGPGELPGVLQERGQSADIETPQDSQHTASCRCQREIDRIEIAHQGHHDAGIPLRLFPLLPEDLVELFELPGGGILMTKDLNHLETADDLFDVAVRGP